MRHLSRLHFLWALWVVVAASAALAEPAAVTLSRERRAVLPVIVVNAAKSLDGWPHTQATIGDLARYLGEISGGAFTVQTVEELPANAGPGIYVGLGKSLQPLGAAGDLAAQECQIRTTPDGKLLLAGGDPRGVSHAVYGLLHELGCRWYYPGNLWAMIPKQPTVTVALDTRQLPAFPLQRRMWMGWNPRSKVIRQDFADWQRRNRIAEPFEAQTGHTWFGMDKPDRKALFAERPELFALAGGERKHKKPCYAHPEVVQRGIQYALDYFEQNPDKQMVSLSPPDGGDFCGCPLTLKAAGVSEAYERRPYRNLFAKGADGADISVTSEEVFGFVNAVAREVARKYPGKQVGVLAYTAYAHPPTFEFEPNVYVEVTTGYRFTPLDWEPQLQAFAGKAKTIGVYQYYDVEQWSLERPGRANVADLAKMQRNLRLYRKLGITSTTGEMSNNFGPFGVGYYVTARLLWDVEQDVTAIEEQFYHDMFGLAAAPVARVYSRWASQKWSWDKQEPTGMLAATFIDLQEAAALGGGVPEVRERVDRLRMYAHFLKLYLPQKLGKAAEDVAAWEQQLGPEKARTRVAELATWASRIMDTHMVHTYAFNMYLKERGDLMKLDTSAWRTPGEIPSAAEVEAAFARDLAELSRTTTTRESK